MRGDSSTRAPGASSRPPSRTPGRASVAPAAGRYLSWVTETMHARAEVSVPRPRRGLALAVLALAGATLVLTRGGALEEPERVLRGVSARLRALKRAGVSSPVLLVEVDDASTREEALGPVEGWPATHLADVIAYLRDSGASAVGLDLPGLKPDADDPEGTMLLLDAIQERERVVVGARGDALAWSRSGLGAALLNAGAQVADADLPAGHAAHEAYPFTGTSADVRPLVPAVARASGAEPRGWPVSPLDLVEPGLAGPARRSFVEVLEEARVAQAAAALLETGGAHAEPRATLARLLHLGEDADLAEIRATLVRRRRALAGKVVLVGLTAAGAARRPTPLGSLPEAWLHALAAEQLLTGERILATPFGLAGVALLLGWCLLLARVAFDVAAQGGALAVGLGALLPTTLAAYLHVANGVLVPALPFALAGAGAALLGVIAGLRARAGQVFDARTRTFLRAVGGRKDVREDAARREAA